MTAKTDARARKKDAVDAERRNHGDIWYAIGKLEGRLLMGFGILGSLNVATFVAVIVK